MVRRKFTESSIAAMNLVPDAYLRGLDRFEARKRKWSADITADGLAVMCSSDDRTAGGDRAEARRVTTRSPTRSGTCHWSRAKPIMQPFGDRSKGGDRANADRSVVRGYARKDCRAGAGRGARRRARSRSSPRAGEKTYYHWLDNIEPWCISRQLWWGHQIPVWYGIDLSAEGFKDDENDGDLDLVELGRLLNEGGMLHRGNVMECAASLEAVTEKFLDDNANIPSPLSHATVIEVADKQEAIHQFAESLAQYAVDQDPTKLVYPVWRDPDVLDTWFSSGLWPIGTLGWPEQTEELERYFPTDVLITGFDILFFWVARMMMMQLAVVDQVPFHTVYLHQLVRDEKGKKMSKTTGNVIDPLEIVDEFGADALRFTNASMAAIGGVLKLSRERITGYRNFGTKLWNAVRFGRDERGSSPTPCRNWTWPT